MDKVDLSLLAVTPGPDRYSGSIDTHSPSSGAHLALEPCKSPPPPTTKRFLI